MNREEAAAVKDLLPTLFNYEGRIDRSTFWTHWLGLGAGSLIIMALTLLADAVSWPNVAGVLGLLMLLYVSWRSLPRPAWGPSSGTTWSSPARGT